MGRVDVPLSSQAAEPKKELPQCVWCGQRSHTVCGRCKARAYCGPVCQRLDWHSGHQTACSAPSAGSKDDAEERSFQFYHLPYIAHWAINLKHWQLRRDSKEFAFLIGRITCEDARQRILGQSSWSAVKVSLAKELAARRLAEIMTQAVWQKVQWMHDEATDRDFLIDREHYIWTGKKYQNSNMRFPNFNFSMAEVGDYLFIVSHPVALTGVYAGGPPSTALPDPREAFALELEAAAFAKDPTADRSEPLPVDLEVAEDGDDAEEDKRMFGQDELLEVCLPENTDVRRKRLRQALVSKFAYFRTTGRVRGRKWSQVVLGPLPVSKSVPGGELDPEENAARPQGPRRHPLWVDGALQKRWRCEVHNWRSHCIVVCRGPPEEAFDPGGEFRATQAERFPEIDRFDDILDHTEPDFIEVPIHQLLPEKWHSDYVRACGGGERGDQMRMNYLGRNAPHVPIV